MKRVEFDGTVHEFPDDFTDQDIASALDTQPAAPVAEAGPVKKALRAAAGPVLWAADRLDSFTGAPIRKGITAAQDYADTADSPNPIGAIRAGVAGAAGQIGRDTQNVPTGKQIYERAGYSGEAMRTAYPNYNPEWGPSRSGISPAGALGFALDLATPVPGLGEIKAVGGVGMRAIGETAKGGVKATAKAAGVAAKTADVLTNTKAASNTLAGAEAALKGMGEGMENMSKALKTRYGSKLAPDAEKSIQTATKNGIDANTLNEAILFGPETSISRQARSLGETPMGQHLRDRNAKLSKDVQEAIRADIRKIAGESKDDAGKVVQEAAIPANAQEAGDLIKSAYDAKVDEILGGMDVTYGSLAKQAPGARIPPEAMGRLRGHLGDLEKYATDLGIDAFDDVTESQAKHLLKTIQKVRGAGDNLGAVTRGMQGLGRTAFKVKTPLGQTPPDLKKIRALYGQLSEAVTEGAGAHFGQETADQLRANNKAVTELFGDKSLIPSLGDVGKSEDKLFRSLILDGDSKRINTLKKYLSPEELKRVKAATLDLLNKENIQGDFTFRNNLSQRLANKTDAINALFDPGELDNITDLFQLGDKIGPSVLSTSGTGASMAHQAASWGDFVSPGKVLDKAERAGDKAAAARQRSAAARAIGFETSPLKAAAQGNPRPPTMGFAPSTTLRALIHGGPAFRKKGLQMFGAQNEEEK